MYKNDGITRRYSEDFKLKILSEFSTGKYSKRQLTRIYGIQSLRSCCQLQKSTLE